MKKYKIFIIDDSFENLQLMFSIIKKHLPDFEVFQTNNPENAFNITNCVKPDIIITDWDMPIISGIELIKSFKSNDSTKNIPIIMATGVMVTSENLKIALDAGAIDYIRKPIEPVELIARVNSAVLLTDYYDQLMQQKDEALTKSALSLVESHEFINDLSSKLIEVKSIIKSKPDNAIEDLLCLHEKVLDKINKNSWMSFEASFSKIHSNFSKNLIGAFPTITPAEIKLCSLVSLGMSNKEIASVLNQAPNSVKVSRYRIRKKIGLDRSDNFEIFLSKF